MYQRKGCLGCKKKGKENMFILQKAVEKMVKDIN